MARLGAGRDSRLHLMRSEEAAAEEEEVMKRLHPLNNGALLGQSPCHTGLVTALI